MKGMLYCLVDVTLGHKLSCRVQTDGPGDGNNGQKSAVN